VQLYHSTHPQHDTSYLAWHAQSWCHTCNLLLLICCYLRMCNYAYHRRLHVCQQTLTYVRAQFWRCVYTQSDEVELTCCCWTGWPPRPQASSWAELHCTLYVTRGGSRCHQVAAQQHTECFVGCSICGHTATLKVSKGRGDCRRSI